MIDSSYHGKVFTAVQAQQVPGDPWWIVVCSESAHPHRMFSSHHTQAEAEIEAERMTLLHSDAEGSANILEE